TSDRRAAKERHREQGRHPSSHLGSGLGLEDAVGHGGERDSGGADRDEDEQLEPEGGRQRRRDQRGAEGEGSAEDEPWSRSSLVRADERAEDRADSHG